MISGSGAIRKATIGKTASGALLDEKGPHGGGHENETVVKLEDKKPSVLANVPGCHSFRWIFNVFVAQLLDIGFHGSILL